MKNICMFIVGILFAFNAFSQSPEFSFDKVRSYYADSVINLTLERYKNLNSYFDSGKVVISVSGGEYPNSTAKIFKTAYTKTGSYNYEFFDIGSSNSLYIINQSSGQGIKSWWGKNNKTKSHDSLDDAFETAEGVSALTSTIIPRLLFSKKEGVIGKNIFDRLTKTTVEESKIESGRMCFKVSGLYKSRIQATIFIDKEDHFIKKITTDMSLVSDKVHAEYHYYPTTKNLNKNVFEYRPNRQVDL